MNRATFYCAFLCAALMTLEWAEPHDPKPEDYTITPEGCVTDREGNTTCDDREEEPTTCAECMTDAECEALCPEE